jgi:hypothetical protein
MEIISKHKKNYGAHGYDYKWTPPAKGMVRAMVVANGKTRHIDIPAQ